MERKREIGTAARIAFGVCVVYFLAIIGVLAYGLHSASSQPSKAPEVPREKNYTERTGIYVVTAPGIGCVTQDARTDFARAVITGDLAYVNRVYRAMVLRGLCRDLSGTFVRVLDMDGWLLPSLIQVRPQGSKSLQSYWIARERLGTILTVNGDKYTYRERR